MYARYVPPSKGKPAPKAASPIAAPEPEPAPQAGAPAPQAVGGAGFSYSRYIPGSKPAKKPADTPTVQYFADEPSPPKPKRKRDVGYDGDPVQEPIPETKKPKKSRSKDKSSIDGEAVGDSVAQDADEGEKVKSKKEKKAKKSRDSLSNGDLEKGEPIDESGEPKTRPKKERKEKKKRKDAKEVEESVPEADEDEADISMVDATEPAEVQETPEPSSEIPTKKKEKKKKKEKTKKTEELDGEELSADEKDRRHKVVLDRKAKSLKLAEKAAPEAEKDESEQELEEVHDLEPLPQPKLVTTETPNPSYETLPSWLAAPIRVSQDTRTPFADLGLLPKATRMLGEKGFPDAFAVQTAAIPLLLPTSKQRPGDLLISAATGSGKTLAYALPIVRDISQGLITRLRALVVLPTRELVKQAQEVFELCAKAYEGGDRKRARIGIAIGSQTLKSEQESLIDSETRYDPEAYRRIQDQRQTRRTNDIPSSDLDALVDPSLQEPDPRLGPWEGQVVEYSSKVDVLICTPGRLVEHLEQTPGFGLDYVRWLVVDEADKLLAQSFQGWLDVVLEKFKMRKFTAREFPDMDLEGVRKIVLSATLTRDLTLLNQLALRRPQLVVLETDGDVQVAEHSLPALLEEFAVRVHDTNLKPLYLLELLKSEHMQNPSANSQVPASTKHEETSDSDATSDTSSDSDSSSDSDTTSDSDSDSNSAADTKSTPKSTLPISLIFTKSNEAALRLSRLLTLLDSSLTPHIRTLTSTTPTHIRRKTLRAFTTLSSPIRLIIASDLVARGIDLPKLDNVINYDLPPSVAAYVHRVGRTARAGRSGRAWTLVGDDESGWFWGKIAKGAGVRRAQKVARTRIDEMSEDKVQGYEEALEKLGQEALDTRRK